MGQEQTLPGLPQDSHCCCPCPEDTHGSTLRARLLAAVAIPPGLGALQCQQLSLIPTARCQDVAQGLRKAHVTPPGSRRCWDTGVGKDGEQGEE